MSEKWETVGSVAKNGKPSKPKSGPKFEVSITTLYSFMVGKCKQQNSAGDVWWFSAV